MRLCSSWLESIERFEQIYQDLIPACGSHPDCEFGLFKQRFRKTEIVCLEDIARVVNKFSVMNVRQLVGTSSEEVIVPSFDWTGYLAPHFKVIKGIKRIHHFTYEEHSLRGGHLITQFTCSDLPTAVSFLKATNVSLPLTMPPMVPLKGLTAERQWYFLKKSGSSVLITARTKHALCQRYQSLY